MQIETIVSYGETDETADILVAVDVYIREAILPNNLIMELAAQDVMDTVGCAREDFDLKLSFRTPIPSPLEMERFWLRNIMTFSITWKDD